MYRKEGLITHGAFMLLLLLLKLPICTAGDIHWPVWQKKPQK